MSAAGPPIFAFVRCHKIKNYAYLSQQTRHARRNDKEVQIREGAVAGTSLRYSVHETDDRDMLAAFHNMKAKHKAGQRKGAALGLHLLFGISEAWLRESGDPHDPENPRNKLLFGLAISFTERMLGPAFAARLDCDEVSAGVTDVYCMPYHNRRSKPKKDGSRKPSVREISTNVALDKVQTLAAERKSYEALQTLWAKEAREKLDPRIVRGERVGVTGRPHWSVSVFRSREEEKRRALAEFDRRSAEMAGMSTLTQAVEIDTRARQAEAAKILDQNRMLANQLEIAAQQRVAEQAQHDQAIRDLIEAREEAEAEALAARRLKQEAEARQRRLDEKHALVELDGRRLTAILANLDRLQPVLPDVFKRALPAFKKAAAQISERTPKRDRDGPARSST